ncbi:MAG: hypothetical protein Q8P50_03620, partial [Bacillota bacterium]|nr:hypothetical protein [Bacillota bacterium]
VINGDLLLRCRQKQGEQVPDGTETVAERLEIERGLLRKLPDRRYPCYRVIWTSAGQITTDMADRLRLLAERYMR